MRGSSPRMTPSFLLAFSFTDPNVKRASVIARIIGGAGYAVV
jgi:hypothetical protein